MSLIFLSLCLVFAVAAYFVMRSFFRSRLTFGELMSRVIPAPAHPVELGTWGQVSELMRLRNNSALYTEAADRYRRIIPACTDEEDVEELVTTYRTFLSNHRKLNSALMTACACVCFGKITKHHCSENVTRYYTKEILLLHGMSEVMDPPSIVVLEGQLTHGT